MEESDEPEQSAPSKSKPTPSPSTTTSVIPQCPCPQSEDEIRAALLEFHKDECCFDKRPAKRMTITSTEQLHAYRYVLQSFVEQRQILLKSVPYNGPVLPAAKKAPEKWSITVKPPEAPPGQFSIDFPETEVVVPCSMCKASGIIPCPKCGGSGRLRCEWCYGTGRVTKSKSVSDGKGKSHTESYKENCSSCSGRGSVICVLCMGTGKITCIQCTGFKYMKNWNYLQVTWSMDTQTFNTERGELTHEKLTKATTSNEAPLVTQYSTPDKPKPLHFKDDPDISKAADYYIQQTLDPKKEWKVLSMQQTVVVVPVVKVNYQYRHIISRFYIYGSENLIYLPPSEVYPGCCCGLFCCDCCCDGLCTIV